MKINPYLNFSGQCEEAFRFYEKVLGGNIVAIFHFGQSPMAGHFGADWDGKVMHVSLKVGDQTILGSDVPEKYYRQPQGFSVCLDFEEIDQAESAYAALSEGGQITMAIQETFWAKRYAQFADRFGTTWMINVSKPM
jgi:PhnB protein